MNVQNLNIQINQAELRECFVHAVNKMRWQVRPPTNQSGLQICERYPEDELISCGSTTDLYIKEYEFNNLHPFYKDSYIEYLLKEIPTQITRLRWMRLDAKSCYSFHRDLTWRFHIPVITNPDSYFLFKEPPQLFHLTEGNCYKVNTTAEHTAINTSCNERVHLVGSIHDPNF